MEQGSNIDHWDFQPCATCQILPYPGSLVHFSGGSKSPRAHLVYSVLNHAKPVAHFLPGQSLLYFRDCEFISDGQPCS